MSDCSSTNPSGLPCQQSGKHLDHAVFVDGRWEYWVDPEPDVAPEPEEPKWTAQEALGEALDLAEQGMNSTWADQAMAAITEAAQQQSTVTGDDVWAWMERHEVEGPSEPRALGVVFLRAARQGIIAKTKEFRDSVRPECCKRPLRVWSSCLFVPEKETLSAEPVPVASDADVTARFMRESGLLWKINHDLLNPLGLALSVDVAKGDNGEILDDIPATLRVISSDEPWEFTPEANAEKASDWERFRAASLATLRHPL